MIYLKTVSETRTKLIRNAAIRHNREKKLVPAYSHSDRWVGASGAWGGPWVGAGEIRWGQGICNQRCGTDFCSDRRLCKRVGSRNKCGEGGRCFLRDNSGGERATPSSHHRNGRGERLRSHCYVVAWSQRTFRASNRQCDKQGADARENPRIGLSVNVQTARWSNCDGRKRSYSSVPRASSGLNSFSSAAMWRSEAVTLIGLLLPRRTVP